MVDVTQARSKGLTLTHDGHDYAFCGKGCLLEFRDDTKTFLAADYSPTM
jgi:YHS domain-containing protein